ncbi:DUF2255 domain-containing protein [Streptomyces sp. NPDC003247]|uniref:DUF2255 domain-containing protein n=1 Tax=Streptomyces sp. NPDC003247 TaxID=3364677 RepID=UPI0036BA93B8
MSTWTREELSLLTETYSLVLTAGDEAGEGVEIGMAVADGTLYVRAYRGVRSRWYRAARQAVRRPLRPDRHLRTAPGRAGRTRVRGELTRGGHGTAAYGIAAAERAAPLRRPAAR